MQCNIDARGRRLRLINGIVTLIAGVVLLFAWALPAGTMWAWAIAIAVLLCGAFMVFQAWAGRCIVRAMGFKTPV